MLTRTTAAIAAALALVATGSALAATHGTTVDLHKTSLGKVLSTSKGLTLYLYTPDPKGKSVCKGGCAAVWPPLTTKGKPLPGTGVRKALLGTTRRSDGKLQVTYAGHPLYLYSGDAKAGQANGEGYGGIWYVLSAAGKKVASQQSGGTTTTGGGGYY